MSDDFDFNSPHLLGLPVTAREVVTGKVNIKTIHSDFLIIKEVELGDFRFMPTAITLLGKRGFRVVGTHIHHGKWWAFLFWRRELFVFLQRAPRKP